MAAYYNEFDPQAAAWLRELIKRGHIAPGDVDERSIEDVRPGDLRGYTQCHFFAGIGGWSLALRMAGWPDEREVWTGSCPCQPFSAAGKGAGFDDERHLWPSFQHLIRECHPPRIFGEQVASRDALAWLDLVRDDLEGTNYAFGAADLCAAGFGAPHIRQRIFWVADANNSQRSQFSDRERKGQDARSAYGSHSGWLGNTLRAGWQGARDLSGQQQPEEPKPGHESVPGRLANCSSTGLEGCDEGAVGDECEAAQRGGGAEWVADDLMQQRPNGQPGVGAFDDAGGWVESPTTTSGLRHDLRPGPTNGFWGSADWLGCRDGKWRPVEPGTFPLAHGLPARVGRLRGYGNAIVPEVAATFIQATYGWRENLFLEAEW
jgi:DNA (cytosine-5)-methyltransferase 1